MNPARITRRRAITEALVALVGLLLLVLAVRANRHWFEVHTMAQFCAETPGQLKRATVERWLLGALGALVLLVVRPRAGRWADRRTARGIAVSVARTGGAALLALLAADLILRAKGKTPEPPLRNFEPDSGGDPFYVYRPLKAHVTERVAGGKPLRWVIDANGYRVRSEDDAVDFARPTVLFTGESIASGFGLNYDETYPAMIREGLGVQTVNLAVQGYASDAAYMRIVDEMPRFAHPLATVTVMIHEQIERDTWPDRPHLVFDDDLHWRVVPPTTSRWDERELRHVPDVSWLQRSPLLELWRKLYHSDEALRRARDVIRATDRETKARGAFALFVLTDCLMNCLPDETGAPSCDRTLFEGLDVAHVRVDIPIYLYDPVIGHPNAHGQRMLADAIERELRAHGVGATAQH